METPFSAWPWLWWSVLVTINVVNLLVAAVIFWKSATSDDPSHARYRKRMRVLGLVFVAVAAYRSVFVSSYLEQLAWFDTLANSSLLIRTLAIFAELSFAGLFMLAMLQVNQDVPAPEQSRPNRFMSFLYTKSPFVLFGCIFAAQFFATTALINKVELLFAIEETLWAIGFLSVLPLAVHQLRRVRAVKDQAFSGRLKMLNAFTVINTLWCGLYSCYALFYHLTIEYWPHVIRDMQAGNVVVRTGVSAVRDAFLVVNMTRDYNAWGGIGFLIWHTFYFSVCVWIVLFLMSGPRLLPRKETP